MIHSKVIQLDSSGDSASGSVEVPPCRFAGIYFTGTDASQTFDWEVDNLGGTVYSGSGASLPYPGINTETSFPLPVVSGAVTVALSSITNGEPGDTITAVLYLDFGGAG